MKRIGLLLVLGLLAIGAWVMWTWYDADRTVHEISVSLPSEQDLNGASIEQTKAAMADCDRIARLEANPVARYFAGPELAGLSERCELIRDRFNSLEGP